MQNGRRWRITAAATILLGLLSPLSAPTSADAATATLTDVKARLVYFTKADRSTDRALALNALGARSSIDARLWKTFLASWDTATTSQKLYYSPPAGLPGKGHTFVLLGTALNSNGTLKTRAINRLKVAMAALAAYPKSTILVTGGKPKHGVTEGGAMRDWLVANGIPKERILTEAKATSTIGNAKYSIALLAARPELTSYTLISDASHLRRAGVLFDAAVLQAQEKRGRTWDLTRIANVAYKDKKIVNPASAATTTVIAENVASLLGLSGYREIAGEPPSQAKLTGLTVVPPSANRFQVGAQLQTSGLKVTAVFDGGAGALEVTDKVILQGFDATQVGNSKVTASYTAGSVTKTAAFTVSVTKAAASVKAKPSTTKVKKKKTRVTVKVKVGSATGVTASGKVRFYAGKTRLKTVKVQKGVASYKLPKFTTTGTKTITVKYSGSKTVTSAETSVKLKVRK